MRRDIISLGIGIAIFIFEGCTTTEKTYWLIYKADPKVAPASTYSGYYDSGNDKYIAACLGLQEEEPTKPPIPQVPQGETEAQKKDRITRYTQQDEEYKKRRAEYKKRQGEYNKTIGAKDCGVPELAKPDHLTDHDQAKIVLHTATPQIDSLNNLDCQITQTKITRKASPLNKDESANLIDTPEPSAYFCDLHARDAGGMRLDFAIRRGGESAGKKTDLVNDSIEVHTLYRFRIMAGPVYSTLSDKDRKFSARSRAAGDSFVGSDVTGNPINAAIFLEIFLAATRRLRLFTLVGQAD